MKFILTTFSLFLFLSIFNFTQVSAKSLGAHVHGSVSLDIAYDKKQLLVMLKSPSESFLKFEYKAKTSLEKKELEKVKNEWNKKIFNLINLKPNLNCKISKTKWAQEFQGKNHSSIIAESYIDCQKEIKGNELIISLKKKYQRINSINVQLIKSDGSVLNKKFKEKTFTLSL